MLDYFFIVLLEKEVAGLGRVQNGASTAIAPLSPSMSDKAIWQQLRDKCGSALT
jgi:hypothetical protein